MSQNVPPRPNRYELPLGNMLGAMVVVIVFVLGFVAFRAFNRDNSEVQLEHVDYAATVTSVRTSSSIAVWAPVTMPKGWYATAARYTKGANPHWHLGASDGTHYLGIEEGVDGVAAELDQAMQGTPTQLGAVKINGIVWMAYADAQGEYALVRSMPSKTPRFPETVVVVGTTAPDVVKEYAASLRS